MENKDKKTDKSFWEKLEGLAWLLIIYFALEALCKWYYGLCKKYYTEKNWFMLSFIITLPILIIYYSVTYKNPYMYYDV